MKTLKNEAAFQSRMLNNLKNWQKYLIGLSTIGLLLAYYCFYLKSLNNFLGVVGILIMISGLLGSLIVGLGIKKGKNNLDIVFKNLQANSNCCGGNDGN